METKQTLGEFRIRTTFNLGNNDKVQNLKERFAHLIDDINNTSKTFSSNDNDGINEQAEFARLKALVLTNLEITGMLAVKLLTS